MKHDKRNFGQINSKPKKSAMFHLKCDKIEIIFHLMCGIVMDLLRLLTEC